MKINDLHLENYRCFDTFKIDFHPQLTVIAAENGGGKTAILDAVTVALGVFVGNFDEGKGNGFVNDDVQLRRTSQTPITMEAQYPLSLEASGDIAGTPQTWKRTLNGKKSKTTIKDAVCLKTYAKKLQVQVRNGETVTLPLLAYYGTERLWRKTKLSKNRKAKHSRSRMMGYDECLNPASNYLVFADWFAALERADFEHRLQQAQEKQTPTHSEFHPLLQSIKQAVNICLRISGWKNLHYRAGLETLVVEHDDYGILPFAQLSDGIRNLLALVGDIAYRAARLNAHLKANAALETIGIILIDEVDLHLHPRWQQTVLHDLTTAFPLLQFIVTSHSPQVLSTVKKEQIRLLNAGEVHAQQPAINPYGRESREVLEDIFHVNSRAPRDVIEETGLLNDYLKRVESGDYDSPQVKEWRELLEQTFGVGDIHLQMADMVIHQWQAKKVN
ncbi:AAA family ATPase [Candidatus Venteria ishoeyi]|uniref:AAA family ATPase n=1 Tax=Candidatus Venteria ishoeyi TaxID=1899563 RepID=UPI0025A4DA7D|nr:AAA family ATPase [Candidatus Venteria ishoeyi]MDM8546022.1 AAA family ATPase [Candidatus Venteria ishoeyi]